MSPASQNEGPEPPPRISYVHPRRHPPARPAPEPRPAPAGGGTDPLRGGRQENDGLGRVRGFAWLGIALLAFGFFLVMAARPGSGTPDCDGEAMEPGDSCIFLTGNRSSYTYEEAMERYEAKKEAWADGPPPQALIGYGLMAVSPVLFVAAFVRYRQVKDAGE